MSKDDSDLLVEAIKQAESQLVSLRARRQKWLNRFAEVEHVRGKAVERAQCKSNLRICNEQIAAAEKKLNAAQHRTAVAEGRAIEEEENMATRAASELDDLCKLAVACDEHAAGLGTAIKQLHSKITEIRQRNGGRGPSGLMVTSMLERCAAAHFAGTTILRVARGPLAGQRTFARTIEAWMPSLSPATPAPSPPISPRKPAPTYARKHGAESIEGAPRLD